MLILFRPRLWKIQILQKRVDILLVFLIKQSEKKNNNNNDKNVCLFMCVKCCVTNDDLSLESHEILID